MNWVTMNHSELYIIRKRFGWRARYNWFLLRVVFDEFVGDSWKEEDGRIVWLSQRYTGNAFWVWIPTWWRQRRAARRDGKIPRARLL